MPETIVTRPYTRNLSQHRPSPSLDTTEQTPKKLSWDELKKKRSLGLCFSCDKKYTPRHRCRKPQLLLMEGDEEEVETEEAEPVDEEPEISLQALNGCE